MDLRSGPGHRLGSLRELLVVLVIVGIASAIAISGLAHLRAQATVAACRADVQATSTAAQAFLARLQRYPESLAELQDRGYLAGRRTTDYTLVLSTSVDGQGFLLTGSTPDGSICATSTS